KRLFILRILRLDVDQRRSCIEALWPVTLGRVEYPPCRLHFDRAFVSKLRRWARRKDDWFLLLVKLELPAKRLELVRLDVGDLVWIQLDLIQRVVRVSVQKRSADSFEDRATLELYVTVLGDQVKHLGSRAGLTRDTPGFYPIRKEEIFGVQ